MEKLKKFSFKHKTTGIMITYMDVHGADAAMQLINDVGHAHVDYEIV